jgi:hypothetical protein
MSPYPEIILAALTTINYVVLHFTRKEIKTVSKDVDSVITTISNGKPPHSNEEIWQEVLELRSTQNKILESMNKWLRKHGRTLQAENDTGVPEKATRVKKSGIILPHG